jgi:hypothetical protein
MDKATRIVYFRTAKFETGVGCLKVILGRFLSIGEWNPDWRNRAGVLFGTVWPDSSGDRSNRLNGMVLGNYAIAGDRMPRWSPGEDPPRKSAQANERCLYQTAAEALTWRQNR